MEAQKKLQKSFMLLLVSAIFILCLGFSIIGCGKDPQTKVAITDKRACAVDFSRAVGPVGAGAFFDGVNEDTGVVDNPLPELNPANSLFTVEAWVKRAGAAMTCYVAGRMDDLGMQLFVNQDVPKFAIMRTPLGGENPPPAVRPLQGCISDGGTSTQCIVQSQATPLMPGEWMHIAGSLTEEDQSGGPGNCAAVGVEMPHLALYINGVLTECATTGGAYAGTPGLAHQFAAGARLSGAVDLDGPLPAGTPALPSAQPCTGLVDDVRYWDRALTEAEIMQCKDEKLKGTGQCSSSDPDMMVYWKLNDCDGAGITDSSGYGRNGGMAIGNTDWSDGWVDGIL